MKQESVNTFNDGLNYDLNPIMTPNTVLTDCVNGTFITFNGDELALQNDSGNTTIQIKVDAAIEYDPEVVYPEGTIVYVQDDTGFRRYYKYIANSNPGDSMNPLIWQELIVRLSNGFYPIGIKEYGGILYIVSAKYPDIEVSEFVGDIGYNKGVVVFQYINTIKYYYESLHAGNTYALPYETDEHWLLVGIEKDFVNKYGYIEFGSYPSPEILNPDLIDTSVEYELVNAGWTTEDEFKAALYAPKVINNSFFRAGNWVTFLVNQGESLILDELSYNSYTITETDGVVIATKVPAARRIYKIKLLHQLANGFIDLTEDVWEKYAIHYYNRYNSDLNIGLDDIKFWFQDPEFRYYCPDNYKGKLAVVVELEPFKTFKLRPSSLRLTAASEYVLTLNIVYENQTNWNNGIVPEVDLWYTTNGLEPDYLNPIETETTNVLAQLDVPVEIVVPMPVAPIPEDPGFEPHPIVRYKVVGKFYYDEVPLMTNIFPQKFIDLHTLNGSRRLITSNENFNLRAEDAYTACELGYTGYSLTTRVALVNAAGEYVDLDGIPIDLLSNTPYYFYLNGTDAPPNPLGTYSTIQDDGRPDPASITPDGLGDNEELLVTLLQDTIVREYREDCATVELTISVNKTFGVNPLTVKQNGVDKFPHDVDIPGKVFKYYVLTNIPFTVSSNIVGTLQYDYTATITGPDSITFGIVTNIGLKFIAGEPDWKIKSWTFINAGLDFGVDIPTSDFVLTQINPAYTAVPTECGLQSRASSDWVYFSVAIVLGQVPLFKYTFTDTLVIDGTYDNLVGIEVYTSGTDHLFLKEYTLSPLPTF